MQAQLEQVELEEGVPLRLLHLQVLDGDGLVIEVQMFDASAMPLLGDAVLFNLGGNVIYAGATYGNDLGEFFLDANGVPYFLDENGLPFYLDNEGNRFYGDEQDATPLWMKQQSEV